MVRKHLAALRAGTAEPVHTGIPSPRKITSWIMQPRDPLTDSQDKRLLEVRLACPDITRTCDTARTFTDLLRHRRGYLLLEWIRQADRTPPAGTHRRRRRRPGRGLPERNSRGRGQASGCVTRSVAPCGR